MAILSSTRVRSLQWVALTAAISVPALVLRITGTHPDPVIAALIYGVAIIGAAFLLSWGAEVAQLDVSASFAIAILALIAVLPEYAIEAVLAWKAGASIDPAMVEVTERSALAAANVTGANRLLIGLGWSLVILIYWLKRRRPLDLSGHMSLEITMLVLASSAPFIMFFMGAVILVAAEPFVESLVETGLELGIDEFILIQWVAPLASESPEIIVAILFSLRANPLAGMSTLISAEVNQLTLLVGSMVGIFSLAAGQDLSFPLDDRQGVEFLLTGAVSVFAIMLIAPRRFSWHVGAVLLGLFIVHLPFTSTAERLIFTYIYLGLAVGLVVVGPRRLQGLFTANPA